MNKNDETKAKIIKLIEAEPEVRNMTVQIRVSPSEHALLTMLANERHLSVGTYMRSEILFKAQEAMKPTGA